ncbi:TPA: DNA cytosine methyltransferase [Listeria monocytogenes]|nr:DNA cytosine methyltransferase [Listeria monocytogenes]HEL7070036.1 DNA cytosine methyltransferase [Listeria monocytogenes]
MELKKKLSDVIDYDSQLEDRYYYSPEKHTFYDLLEQDIVSQDTLYQWRRQYVRENKSNVSPTLTANMGTGGHNVPLILSKHGIRKLTPRECFNLQGYPPSYILPNIAISHLYKQAGNSVVVPVIKRIAENISMALEEASKIDLIQLDI